MKTKTFAVVAIALLCAIIPAQTAFASDYYDSWGYGGSDSGYYFDTYTPSYYSDSYSSGYYSDSYTPSYYSDSYTPSYSSGYSYTPSYSSYSTPSYTYTPSSSGSYYAYIPSTSSGYTYTPTAQSTYVYTPSTSSASNYSPSEQYTYVTANPTATSNSTASASASQWTYVSNTNSNENNNSNSNENNNNNSTTVTNNPTFINNNNPTNINDVNIVVLAAGAASTSTGSTSNTLDGNCYISPTNSYINQDVTFSASATGGNGSYSYSWSGSDGISAYAQSFTGRFSSSGYKTATVVITSNGQSISRSCNTYVQGSTTTNLSAYCVASPSNPAINQTVTWTAYPSGGNGSYYYSWSGDGLYGNGQSVNTSYSTTGYKYGSVAVTSNGQTVYASCNTNVGSTYNPSTVTVVRDTTLGTPVSGVFLSQVPATGISLNLKMSLFIVGLLAWSLFVAFVINEKRKAKLATVGGAFGASIESRIEAFKKANMAKKGLI